MKDMFLVSMLAGICISIGGLVNLRVGGVEGAFLFAFGLLSVIHYRMYLYTGMAGFVEFKSLGSWAVLLIVLIGNVVGCAVAASLFTPHAVIDAASDIIDARIDSGLDGAFCSAIGCGTVMTLIVKAGRMGNKLLVVFGVAVFIRSGFYHSIADAYYLFMSERYLWSLYIPFWGVTVLGNLVGCNIPRILGFMDNLLVCQEEGSR